MASTGPHSERQLIFASETSQSTRTLRDVESLALVLEPNTHYKFKYLIYFQAKYGLVLGMHGPLRPTFSGFRAETPLLAAAEPLKLQLRDNEVTVKPILGSDGIVELSGTFRTGRAHGTLLPRFASLVEGFPAVIKPESSGALYDLGP